jgi:hypothetical protein
MATQDEPEWMLYVASCPTFDPNDEDGEWATEYLSFPSRSDHYLPLSRLGITIGDDRAEELAAVVSAVQRLRLEGSVAAEGAAVGFDDGDFITWQQ